MEQAAYPPLAQSLDQVPFPISRDMLVREYGETRFQLDSGEVLTLDSALTRIEQPEFRSISDLSLAIGEIRRSDSATHL